MINILIVEDDGNQLKTIKETIAAHLGHLVDLHPQNIADTEGNLNDFNKLIEALQKREFKEVAEHYRNIDFYIIDVTLLSGRNDRLGIEFYEYLQKNNSKMPEAIITSNTSEMKQFVRNVNTPFVAKLPQGLENYPNEMVEIIKKKYKLNEPGSPNNPSFYQLFKKRIEVYGWRYAIQHVIIAFIRNLERYLVDPLILGFFYILLLVAVIFGGINIFEDITHLNQTNDPKLNVTPSNQNVSSNINHLNQINDPKLNVIPSNQNASSNIAQINQIDDPTLLKTADTKLLETAEHIFLNLLPIFIIFGFFNYYKTNLRISLLEGNISAVDDETSTKAMNLSKILFVSSIISYVLIKIVEKIFFKAEALDITKLIASGIFLLLLMSYFIFLDRKKH